MPSYCRATCVLLLLMLLSGCHRASYQFQAVGDASLHPATAVHSSATVVPAAAPFGVAASAARASSRHGGTSGVAITRKKPRSRMPVAAMKRVPVGAKPAGRALESLRPVVHQLVKARLPHAARTNEPIPPERYRSRGIALLLAIVPFFYGILGLHRFYLGYSGHGIAYLLGGLLAIFMAFLGAVGLAYGGSGFMAIFIPGALMAAVLFGLQISDVVRIITGSLKPKNGEYNPGFFQTKPRIEVPVPEQR